MRILHHSKLVFATAVLAVIHATLCIAGTRYQSVGEIPVPDSSRPSVLCLDTGNHRLYAATASNVFVIDLGNNQVIRQSTNLIGVRSLAVVSRFKSGFCVSGSKNGELELHSLALPNLTMGTKLQTGQRPELVLASPDGATGLCFNSGDNTVTLFEPDDGDFMGNVPLGETPRSAVIDPKSGQVYCAMKQTNQIAVFRSRGGKQKEINRWSTAPGERPSAVVFDPTLQRLLVGCSNGALLLVDPATTQVVDSLTIDSGAEILAFDPSQERLFVTAGKGVIAIVTVTPRKLFLQGTVTVPGGSRCLAVDPQTHKLYVGSESKILIYGE